MVDPSMASPFWRAAGVSVRGARHIMDGTPCQDAVHVVESRDWVILCAADGHGDKKHAKSHEGAQIAVEIAAELLEAAIHDLGETPSLSPNQITHGLKSHLPRRLSWEWNRRVKAAAGLSGEGDWDKALVLYGTTIMAVALTREFALFLQLGDGDMMLLRENGRSELIFEPDEEMYGSLTHSLCQPNNAIHARVSCRKLKNPTLLILSTDGLRDSIQGDTAKFIGVGKWIQQWMGKDGWDGMLEGLPEWLGKVSEKGNGDDTTVGLVSWLPGPGEHEHENRRA